VRIDARAAQLAEKEDYAGQLEILHEAVMG